MGLEDQQQNNPKGYKPLQLEYRDNHLYMSDGTLFLPDFEVGASRGQIDLFIEYERTFGRGKAFEITHQTTEESRDPEVLKKYGGDGILSDFKMLAQMVPLITAVEANRSKVPKYIEKIKEFRRNYPLLYGDADQHQGPGHI